MQVATKSVQRLLLAPVLGFLVPYYPLRERNLDSRAVKAFLYNFWEYGLPYVFLVGNAGGKTCASPIARMEDETVTNSKK